MISISKQYSFDSSHILWRHDWDVQKNKEIFGKCSRRHGHTYLLTVEVTGHVKEDTGMIINYFDLDEIVKPYVDGVLDHVMLDLDVFPNTLTTAENMVGKIVNYLKSQMPVGIKLSKVTLQETPKTTATWQA